MNRLVCLFRMMLIIVYITAVMIINLIINAWSWKKINCSMSCVLRFNRVVIVGSNESFNTLFVWLKSNALICHVRVLIGEMVGLVLSKRVLIFPWGKVTEA